MNLRLTQAETDALRRNAAEEGTVDAEVARAAIAEYVRDRPARLSAAIARVRTEDAELLERLSVVCREDRRPQPLARTERRARRPRQWSWEPPQAS